MQVSIEMSEGLERRIRVEIPQDEYNESFNKRVRELAQQVKIPGFRPGKVTDGVVKQRFGKNIGFEIAEELMKNTIYEALQKIDIKPMGAPKVDIVSQGPGQAFVYTIFCEVRPEIEFSDFSQWKLEKVKSSVSDQEVDDAIEKVRAQRGEQVASDSPAEKDDQLTIDYDVYLDGELVKEGSAQQVKVTLGGYTWLPEFEQGLLGVSLGEERDIQAHCPKNYHVEQAADKDVVFKVKVHRITKTKLAELDDAFVEKLGIKGGAEGLRTELRKHMEHELHRRVKAMNRDQIYKLLLKEHTFEVPKTLMAEEITLQREEAEKNAKRMGIELPDKEKADENFTEMAHRRVFLGLLIGALTEQNDIKPDPEKVRELAKEHASLFEDPSEVLRWLYEKPERLQHLEFESVQAQVLDKIYEQVNVTEKDLTYNECMFPSQESLSDDKESEKTEESVERLAQHDDESE